MPSLTEYPANAVTLDLLLEIRKHYQLDWYGIHGVIHWARVYENGMMLSRQNRVNRKVVQLFSVFHDSQRINEGQDKGHGRRGAELAAKLRGFIQLADDEFSLLTQACRLHTSAITHTDITLQVCFDADRLDLGRVGKVPDPRFLSTSMAKNNGVIESCYAKSLNSTAPEFPFGLEVSRNLL